jgi:hypothetical protein
VQIRRQIKLLSSNVSSSLTRFFICYSTSFIVITLYSMNVADVYRRLAVNNSAIFMYRINDWNQLRHCVIINNRSVHRTMVVCKPRRYARKIIIRQSLCYYWLRVIYLLVQWLLSMQLDDSMQHRSGHGKHLQYFCQTVHLLALTEVLGIVLTKQANINLFLCRPRWKSNIGLRK